MFFMLKFAFYFSVSFIILSFPLTKGTLFNLIHSQTNEYTQKIFKSFSSEAKKGIKKGAQYTKKIFSNSEPTIQDKVFSQFSSTDKKQYVEKEVQDVYKDYEGEKFTDEEKEILNKILKEGN